MCARITVSELYGWSFSLLLALATACGAGPRIRCPPGMTAPRTAITSFVDRTTTEGSPDFVPVEERIAVFDNDGTPVAGEPDPVPVGVRRRRDQPHGRRAAHPQRGPDGAGPAGGRYSRRCSPAPHHEGLLRILALTHSGMTTDDFDNRVATWIATAKHPSSTGLTTN